MSGKFDLDTVCDLIIEHGLLRVALQFPDEFLTNCVSIYTYIIKRLANDSIDVFIIGDSTYGSSIDDISAQHVDSDVLIYFGSDLSSSGSVPVMVVPFSKDIDETSCIEELNRALDQNAINHSTTVLLIYELSYSSAIGSLMSNPLLKSLENVVVGELPPSSNLMAWTPNLSRNHIPASPGDNFTKVGGLLVASDVLKNPDLLIWYIGGKEEQLVSIHIRMSENLVISYSPDVKICKAVKGYETREFRERYGGLLRVKDAQIIGIIVGSMGLSGDVTQAILARLETLIRAAKKSSYVFIMGRLNEAKLCNFPEIDIFCLISNEDVALIKPKTFHVPVVTPWEIELGLGGREWRGVFRSESESILSDVSIEEALKGVIAALPEDNIDPDSDSDCDIEDLKGVQLDNRHSEEVKKSAASDGSVQTTAAANATSENTKKTSALSVYNSERSLVAFTSPAADYFNGREFQGLIPVVPEGQNTDIQQGQVGIAKSYKRYDKNCTSNDK